MTSIAVKEQNTQNNKNLGLLPGWTWSTCISPLYTHTNKIWSHTYETIAQFNTETQFHKAAQTYEEKAKYWTSK